MEKAYSKEVRERVIEARKSGMKVNEICKKFHICDQTIRDWMKGNVNAVGQTSIRKASKTWRLFLFSRTFSPFRMQSYRIQTMQDSNALLKH